MKLGIVGLPNVGKSTLFNAITKAGAEVANYPFCTIEPNVGVVTVPDDRLELLQDIYGSKKIVHTTIDFFDIAGLVKGASKGEGLGNRFLGHIREVAAIVHVVRCFESDTITHVTGSVDPVRDIEIIDLELILSDLEFLARRMERVRKAAKGDKFLFEELNFLEKVETCLQEGKSARTMALDEDESALMDSLNLLSAKPVIYVANVAEDEVSSGEENPLVLPVLEFAQSEGSPVVIISAEIEAEIAELDDEERAAFLEEMGIGESGLEKLIRASYSILDLISFLTANKSEARAWTLKRGTKVLEAAGNIHTDFARGFIRAEVIAYDKLKEVGGTIVAAKEKGLVRSEGKEYVVKDGDVIYFLFNV